MIIKILWYDEDKWGLRVVFISDECLLGGCLVNSKLVVFFVLCIKFCYLISIKYFINCIVNI